MAMCKVSFQLTSIHFAILNFVNVINTFFSLIFFKTVFEVPENVVFILQKDKHPLTSLDFLSNHITIII